MKPHVALPSALVVPVLLATTVDAQDRHDVRGPVVPAACATLEARLSAPGGLLSEADEARPDTARIQEALDGCPPADR
jgi:polygalacturonase